MAERLIGGFFALEPAQTGGRCNVEAGALSQHRALWVNARSIINELLKLLQPPVCWVPSYICDTVLSAIPDHVKVCWYSALPGDRDMFDVRELESVAAEDIVLIVDYFGFSTQAQQLIDQLAGRVRVVRDSCMVMPNFPQLFSPRDRNTTRIYSFRKTLGVPDGALALSNASYSLPEPTEASPMGWFKSACKGRRLRGQFEAGQSVDGDWFELYQRSERNQPVGPYKISDLSRTILAQKTDWSKPISKRRENYQYLWHRLKAWSLFGELEEGDVPIGFPCLVNRRDALLQMLYSVNIYPAIHWDLSNIVPECFVKSHEIANKIMTLPCDQRYDLHDMKKVADEFLNAMRLV
jgi:hypothetical protein